LSKAAEQVVLVASSEFTLKSSAVRRTLEQRLIDDLKFTLKRGDHECSRVEKDAGRLVVFGTKQTDGAAALCSRVFGVAYAAAARLLINPSIEDITETIAELAQERLTSGKSFAVRAHRSTAGAISRRDVEVQGGSKVLGAMKGRGVSVDLDAPDVTFYVDLVGSDAYLYCEKMKGPGGLPLSAQWKMLGVLDRGPLSILAACAMMRRGCVVELLIPVSDTIPGLSAGIQRALAEKVGKLVTRPNYKGFMAEIDGLFGGRFSVSAGWRGVVRAVAVKFARENRFKGVIFGDVAGQLSSLSGRYSTSTRLPLFYPLLGLEAEDLIELSRLAGVDESELLSQRDLEYKPGESAGDIGSDFGELVLPSVREVHF
jgi:thiamine biosynthesis protein ThiI